MSRNTKHVVPEGSFVHYAGSIIVALMLLPVALFIVMMMAVMVLPAAVVGLPFLVSALLANAARLPRPRKSRPSEAIGLRSLGSATGPSLVGAPARHV